MIVIVNLATADMIAGNIIARNIWLAWTWILDLSF